jgi:hypothetical protein
MRWKYIVFDTHMAGVTPLLFPEHVSHADLKNAFQGAPIVSAGFVDFNDVEGKLHCTGKSDTLGVCSRPEDEVLVNRLIKSRWT